MRHLQTHRPIRVLVVDDVPLLCRLISDALNSDPELRLVGTAANGLEAIRLVGELKPDVVTMDIAAGFVNDLAQGLDLTTPPAAAPG